MFKTSEEDSPTSEETFLYFAYGCNLLAKRIHDKNPTAIFFSIVKLPPKIILCFSVITIFFSAMKNIIYDEFKIIDYNKYYKNPLSSFAVFLLDDQEGLILGAYKIRNVSVHTPDGNTLTARTYQMTMSIPKVPAKDIPEERQPSDTYMKVILYGAFECSLPMYYIRHLFDFPTNGQFASLTALENLDHHLT